MKVLVIESGSLDKGEDGVDIPGDYNELPFTYLYNSYGVPQKALLNKEFLAPMGHVVGGGSTVNGMVWLRAGKEEYDVRVSLGATGWAWNDFLPYFKKSENFTAPNAAYAKKANISFTDSVHGHAGPVQLSYPNFYFPGAGQYSHLLKITFSLLTPPRKLVPRRGANRPDSMEGHQRRWQRRYGMAAQFDRFHNPHEKRCEGRIL